MDAVRFPIKLKIDAMKAVRTIAAVCIGFELLIVLLDAFITYGDAIEIQTIQRLCNITREDSFANWFSCTQLFMVGLVLWFIFFANSQASAPKRSKFGWLALALFFSYMALDDGSMLHERIGTAAKESLEELDGGPSVLERFPSYAWQAVVGPFFVAMGIFMAYFFLNEFKRWSQRIVLLGAIGCYASAMGLDFLEKVENGPYQWIQRATQCREYTVSHFAKSLEETLENFGTTLFLVVFLLHFARICSSIEIETRRDA